jgi:hypothetical protein
MTLGQFQLAGALTHHGPPAVGELSGRRLYSPLALTLLAMLGNLPIAVALLGINFRRRGRRAVGNSAIAVSIIAAVFLIAYSYTSPNPRSLGFFGFAGGLLIFGIERPAFVVALREGAGRARWWPPWLLLVGIAGIIVAVSYFQL